MGLGPPDRIHHQEAPRTCWAQGTGKVTPEECSSARPRVNGFLKLGPRRVGLAASVLLGRAVWPLPAMQGTWLG